MSGSNYPPGVSTRDIGGDVDVTQRAWRRQVDVSIEVQRGRQPTGEPDEYEFEVRFHVVCDGGGNVWADYCGCHWPPELSPVQLADGSLDWTPTELYESEIDRAEKKAIRRAIELEEGFA